MNKSLSRQEKEGRSRTPDRNEESNKRPKVECSYGEKCYRKKPKHFEDYAHKHLEKLLMTMCDRTEIPSSYVQHISRQTLKEQLEILRKHVSPQKVSTLHSRSIECVDLSYDSSPESPTNSPRKSFGSQNGHGGCIMAASQVSPCKASTSRSQEDSSCASGTNTSSRECNKYKVECLKMSKFSVREKMEAAAPYNVFLTTIANENKTHEELLSISFPELLDPYFGELDSSLQINFMVQFSFLLAQYYIQYPPSPSKRKKLTLVYGECDLELGDSFGHFLTHVKVNPPSSYGSHHTKMMIFAYTDQSIRVVVSTANLVEDDWRNRTQGLWISPECPRLPAGSDTDKGDSQTHFKRDLLRYLAAYRLPQLHPWIEKVRGADMSGVDVFFVASIPGTHTTHKSHWGQLKMRSLLRDHLPPPPAHSPVIVQCSSIGSLGPSPSSWLLKEVLAMLADSKQRGIRPSPPIKLVYPTFECISNSLEGLLGGGCLPYSKRTHVKQPWLNSFMCDWRSESRHRSKAPPHIKCYTRVTPDHSQASYFLLTSANLSKAAWGCQTSSGGLNILSYEAGILLLPQFLIKKDYFPLKKKTDDDTPVFSLPYDLPLTPFTYSCVPWFIDCLC